jgi:hypothetical protein
MVYLDAAYDRSRLMQMFAKIPGQPNPTAADSVSIVNLSQYVKEIVGVNMLDEEITEMSVFSKENRFLQ